MSVRSHHINTDRRKGQALLLAVVILGAVILSATTIAGLLMLYQIRGATDIANSQKAIAAADAGLECQMYDEFQGSQTGYSYLNCSNITFSNGASASTTCTDASDKATDCSNISSVSNIYSTGAYGSASRVLQLSF